ncbi:MAG: glycosyltransferase [Pseudoprimorskyibacter sp.]|nr:glycosyltransferase [Pseudoprimorskyibacter sp.]
MRIMIFAPNYLPATRYGGPVRSTHGLARGLAEIGHEVHVMTTDVDGPDRLDVDLESPTEMDGVQVHYCPIVAPRRLYHSPALAARAAKLMPTMDGLHVNGVFLWPGPKLARMAQAARVPVVMAPRGMLVPEMVAGKSRIIKTAWIALQERAALARARAIHVTSDGEAQSLARMGLDLAPVKMIGNGVTGPSRAPTPAEIEAVWGHVPKGSRVAFLARLDWTKGADMAIAATRAVPGAHILLAGHDQIGLRANLEQGLTRADGSICGAFLGPVDGMRKWALLAGADVVLVPSVRESFGMSAAEALAMGTPVIASDGVGLAPFLRQIDPALVVPRDQSALNAALAALLADPGRILRLQTAALDLVVREMTWTGIAARVAALFDRGPA